MNISIKTLSIAVLIVSLSSCSDGVSADTPHACEAASPATIANHFGLAESEVAEEVVYESPDKITTTECKWQFTDADGHQTFVHYRKRERNEKVTNPTYFSANIARLIANGQNVGRTSLAFSALNLAGVSQGALSEMGGNKYTRELVYQWRVKEDRMKKIFLARSVNEAGTMKEPLVGEIEKLVELLN